MRACDVKLRKIVDPIVQSSTVALFHEHEVALAPDHAPSAHELPEAASRVRFCEHGFEGTLDLAVPMDVLARIAKDHIGLHGGRERVRELTNQLMGRIKNRLLSFRVALQVGVPSLLIAKPAAGHPPNGKTRLIYSFRSRNGRVIVMLEGLFDQKVLVFSPGELAAREGDVILF